MSEEKTFNSLKERIAFIQRDVDLLAQNKGRSFADDIIFRSLDSHLSDLRERQRAIDNQHPLRDFMELRLKRCFGRFRVYSVRYSICNFR